MLIEIEDPIRADIQALLQGHLRDMRAISPPASVHALDINALRTPQITFLAARNDGVLLGCGALKALDSTSGESKSMRTADGHLRKGVAAAILLRILEIARERGYQQVSLETGRPAVFKPAQRLYERSPSQLARRSPITPTIRSVCACAPTSRARSELLIGTEHDAGSVHVFGNCRRPCLQ